MATWTNVPNTVLEPGDPIRSVDIIAIKENIIALSEGASGAPAIQTAALATGERMNTTNVLNATAGASLGAVGTYALLRDISGSARSAGDTVSGSSLGYSNCQGFWNGAISGTWRLMGRIPSGDTSTSARSIPTSSWLRIS
jgi:hypothetical protein